MGTRKAWPLLVAVAVAGCGNPGAAQLHVSPKPSASSAASGVPATGVPTSHAPVAGSHASASRQPPAGSPGAAPPAGGGGAGSQPTASPDAGALGDMSRAFLRPTPYQRIVVELDVGGNAAPSSAVVSNLVGVLGRESSKPVSTTGHSFPGKGNGCWSDQDVLGATSSQRQVHTQGSTAALLALFVDGTYCADSNVIGFAYGASEMLVFTRAVENLSSSPTVGPDAYVKAVSVHELGHVLGLVNIGYHSRIDHEDPAHPHHSKNSGSVMYYAIDQGNLLQQLATGPPQTFDSDDEADLAGLRDGTY